MTPYHKDSKQNYAMVLASGGIDSTACIHFYKNLGFEVDVLFVNYNQPSIIRETAAINAIARYYDIKLREIHVENVKIKSDGNIPGRNAMFIFMALNNLSKSEGIIVLGIHAGTQFFDCSPSFLSQMQAIIEGYSQGTVKLSAPFIGFNKAEILQYCHSECVPLALTYSCELGLQQPCGICSTCKELTSIN